MSWSHAQGINISPWRKHGPTSVLTCSEETYHSSNDDGSSVFRSESMFIAIKQVFVINVKRGWSQQRRLLITVGFSSKHGCLSTARFSNSSSFQLNVGTRSRVHPGNISKVDPSVWLPVLRMSSHQGRFICQNTDLPPSLPLRFTLIDHISCLMSVTSMCTRVTTGKLHHHTHTHRPKHLHLRRKQSLGMVC